MRKGENLSKDILLPDLDSDHRIIIPLYIPEEEGYYEDAFTIFTYCVISIKKTSLTNIKISVVSNGCSDAVNIKLLKLQQDNFIDELIIERENIGKINSILKALRTAQERLITITDGDVLFCNNWEDAITEIFESFPNAGAVCPVPVFRKQLNMTMNIWFKYFFSKKLYFRSVKNPAAMEKFAQSLGWFSLEDRFKDLICTLKAKNGTVAVLGCSHFVATYKREVFDTIPQINSLYKLGGDSEQLYLDLPVIKMGGYRLSTHDNFAFHLGNHLEPWMEEKFNELSESIKIEKQYSNLKKLTKSPSNFWLTEKVFKQLFYNQKFYNYVLRLKGISKEKIETFWY
jgi:hypothetical protein